MGVEYRTPNLKTGVQMYNTHIVITISNDKLTTKTSGVQDTLILNSGYSYNIGLSPRGTQTDRRQRGNWRLIILASYLFIGDKYPT